MTRQTGNNARASANLNQATIHTAEKDREVAIFMADRTHTFDDAVAHFGLSRGAIGDCRDRALRDTRAEGGREYLNAHLIEISALREVSWAVLRAHHVHVADGRVVVGVDDDGVKIVITDHKPVLMAVDRLIKLQERESRLLGLDAPTRQTITVLTEDVVDAAIRTELAAMEALDAELAATGADGRSTVGEAPATS